MFDTCYSVSHNIVKGEIMELRKRFGKRIRELRRKAGLTQAEFAERVGIATKTQSSIECGINFPKVQQIESYARVLNLDVADILDLSDTPKVEENYLVSLNDLISKANDKQVERIYRLAKLVMED